MFSNVPIRNKCNINKYLNNVNATKNKKQRYLTSYYYQEILYIHMGDMSLYILMNQKEDITIHLTLSQISYSLKVKALQNANKPKMPLGSVKKLLKP